MSNDENTQVADSSPAMRTIFTKENGNLATIPKDSQNISEGFGDENEQIVKYPKRLRHRKGAQ
jgi:hypothetical protein